MQKGTNGFSQQRRSRMRNEAHLPAVPGTDEEHGNNTCFNPPRLPIQPIGGVVHDVTLDFVRSTCRELNEPIFTRLNRLSPELPVNFETLEDLVTRLESLESVQRSHQLETKPTISAVSALCVDVNRLMKEILTRVIGAQQQANEKQSKQPALKIPNQQPTEQPDRDSNVNSLFTPINQENSDHHVP